MRRAVGWGLVLGVLGGCFGSVTATPAHTTAVLLRRQVAHQCLEDHYCSPANNTQYTANTVVQIAWNTRSPFFSNPTPRSSIRLELLDISTRTVVWQTRVPNAASGTVGASQVQLTDAMLDGRASRTLQLSIQQQQQQPSAQTASLTPPLPLLLTIVKADAAEPSSTANGDPSVVTAGDQQAGANGSSTRFTTPIIAAIAACGLVAVMGLAGMGLLLVRRRRRDPAGVFAAPKSADSRAILISDAGSAPSKATTTDFIIPAITISPPTLRSKPPVIVVTEPTTETVAESANPPPAPMSAATVVISSSSSQVEPAPPTARARTPSLLDEGEESDCYYVYDDDENDDIEVTDYQQRYGPGQAAEDHRYYR